MAERNSSLQKPLLARKGEARPAEPGSREQADHPIEPDQGGYVFLRSKDPTLDIGPLPAEGNRGLATTAVPPGEAPGSEAPESEALESEAPESEVPESEVPESEVPESEAPVSEATESEATESEATGSDVLESSVFPSDSEDLSDRSAAGSLLDFRLIRARDRQVCPGASSKAAADGPSPKLDLGSLGGAVMDVPRRAVPRPLTAAVPSPQPLPQPLPLARQGDAEDVQAQRGRSPAAEPVQQVIPPVSDRPRHVRPAQEEGARQERPISRKSYHLPKIDGAALAELLGNAGHFTWARLRSFASMVAGTPHLAYLAGLLMLCALGGVWVILAEEMPSAPGTPLVAALSSSPPSSSTPSEAPPALSEAAEDGLDVGAFKAAPMLSGEQADALPQAPLETEAGPAVPPVAVVPPAAPAIAADAAAPQNADAAAPQNDAVESPSEPGASLAEPETAAAQAAAVASPQAAPEEAAPTETAAPTAAIQQSPQAAPAAQEGGYTVQFFAARNRESAERELARLQKDLSSILGERQLHISEIKQSDSRSMFRVRSDAFAEASAARDFCGKLKSAGQDCLVLRRQ